MSVQIAVVLFRDEDVIISLCASCAFAVYQQICV